jgi:hypothetical protein
MSPLAFAGTGPFSSGGTSSSETAPRRYHCVLCDRPSLTCVWWCACRVALVLWALGGFGLAGHRCGVQRGAPRGRGWCQRHHRGGGSAQSAQVGPHGHAAPGRPRTSTYAVCCPRPHAMFCPRPHARNVLPTPPTYVLFSLRPPRRQCVDWGSARPWLTLSCPLHGPGKEWEPACVCACVLVGLLFSSALRLATLSLPFLAASKDVFLTVCPLVYDPFRSEEEASATPLCSQRRQQCGRQRRGHRGHVPRRAQCRGGGHTGHGPPAARRTCAHQAVRCVAVLVRVNHARSRHVLRAFDSRAHAA